MKRIVGEADSSSMPANSRCTINKAREVAAWDARSSMS